MINNFYWLDVNLTISLLTNVQVGLGDTWTLRVVIKPLHQQDHGLVSLSITTYVYSGQNELGISGNHVKSVVEEIYGYISEVSFHFCFLSFRLLMFRFEIFDYTFLIG